MRAFIEHLRPIYKGYKAHQASVASTQESVASTHFMTATKCPPGFREWGDKQDHDGIRLHLLSAHSIRSTITRIMKQSQCRKGEAPEQHRPG